MLKKVISYLSEGFDYTGIEITESEGENVFFVLQLSRRKGELLVRHKKRINTIDELPAHIPKNNLLLVCLNTSKVLTKEMETIGSANTEEIVHQAFPSLDLDKYYYEVIQDTSRPIVTIVKKEAIAETIRKIKELQLNIYGFTIGISAIQNLLPYLRNRSITLSNKLIHLEDRQIALIVPKNRFLSEEYTINGLQLTSEYLLSFAQILGHLNQREHKANFEEVSERLKWEFKNHRFFNHMSRYALAFFVLLLLFNFVLYNFYFEEVTNHNASISSMDSLKHTLETLETSVKRKEERTATLNNASSSKVTKYLDLLAQEIPATILLDEIKYRPLIKPVRASKPILLEDGTLLLAGTSKNSDDFSLWIRDLEKYPWIHTVVPMDYGYVSGKTSNFLIEIRFDED